MLGLIPVLNCIMARAVSIPVGRRLGGQLATTLVATISDSIAKLGSDPQLTWESSSSLQDGATEWYYYCQEPVIQPAGWLTTWPPQSLRSSISAFTDQIFTKLQLSQPQLNLNSTQKLGVTRKWLYNTPHHHPPPTQTQYHRYLSCTWPAFKPNFKGRFVGSTTTITTTTWTTTTTFFLICPLLGEYICFINGYIYQLR